MGLAPAALIPQFGVGIMRILVRMQAATLVLILLSLLELGFVQLVKAEFLRA
jgi:hypothetical protein